MADDRKRHAAAATIDELAQGVGLEREGAQTEYGNVLAILERGAEDQAERAIVAAFVAGGVLRAVEADPSLSRRWAERLAWLGAHAGFDPLAALPSDAPADVVRPLHRAVAELARQIDLGKVPEADRAELLVCTAALATAVEGRDPGSSASLGSSEGPGANDERGAAGDVVDPETAQIVSRLAADLTDPVAARLITARADGAPPTVAQSGPSIATLAGKLAPAPRSPLLTIAFALSGFLLVRAAAILVGDHLLGLKRDAKVELTPAGLSVRAKIALLGRDLRDLHAHFPVDGLATVRREVRWPGLPVYAGLLALLIGTYAGVSFLSWGVQAASPRLLGYGVLALIAGVALDLILVAILPGARGEVRLLLVPKQGRRICVGALDLQATDRLLADLAKKVT